MIVSKTRNANGSATKADNLIPNGVKCNENVIWVSVMRLTRNLLEAANINVLDWPSKSTNMAPIDENLH